MTTTRTALTVSHVKAAVFAVRTALRHWTLAGFPAADAASVQLEAVASRMERELEAKPSPSPQATTAPTAASTPLPAPPVVLPQDRPLPPQAPGLTPPAPASGIPTDVAMPTDKGALAGLCARHGVRVRLGAGASMMRRDLAAARDRQPAAATVTPSSATPEPIAPPVPAPSPVTVPPTQTAAVQAALASGTLDALAAACVLIGATVNPGKGKAMRLALEAWLAGGSQPTVPAAVNGGMPATYQQVVALGQTGLETLATKLAVKTGGLKTWTKKCSAVWKALQGPKADTQTAAPAATAGVQQMYVPLSDGTGKYRPASKAEVVATALALLSEEELWAILDARVAA